MVVSHLTRLYNNHSIGGHSENQPMSPELSIPINVAQLPSTGITINKRIKKDICSKIASRVAVDVLESFIINISVCRGNEPNLTANIIGKINATIIQACSVTLEPISSTLCIPVNLTFAEENHYTQANLTDINPEEEAPPELMSSGEFDLGDVLIQLLAVEINPFPRKPETSFDDYQDINRYATEERRNISDHPFSKLAELKDILK